MTPDMTTLVIVLIIGFAAIIWFLNQKLGQTKDDQTETTLLAWLKSTQTDIKSLQTSLTQTLQRNDKNVTDTLQKSYQELNTRLDNAAKVIGELKIETGKFSEIGRSMKALDEFLSAPKLRGNLGEQILNDLLAEILPTQKYATQYRFHSGDIVDAVIKTRTSLIPIDSKFPMENFTKMNQAESKKDQSALKKVFISDVKKHIKAISQKYIKTDEKTTDFALMYIPAESVYYEITANSGDLDDYARRLRVLCVSPSTLYAFLRTILVSFEGQRIAQEATKILANLRAINHDATDFSAKLDTLSRHITNAYNNMNTVSSDFNRLQSKITDTQSLGSGLKQNPELPAEEA